MKIYRRVLIAAIFSIACNYVAAQPPTQTDPNGGGKPGTAPIGGIGILIAVGGLLGAKKIFDSKKER
jgi:hypothetical protein